jgi:membrane-bound ClpP family serine protease
MRDDFINYIKENLAKRVGMRCSNPNCRQLTNGPSSDPKKSVNIGVAAHIAAASPGGKRYDSQQTSAQRSAISNGIWLCQNCAKLIDSDEKRFQIEVLHKWKLISEEAARYDVENKTLDEIKHIINNINITSVNQSGGQVAHTIINQKAQRRSIPTDIQTAIANRLKNFPPEKFTIRL